MSINLIKYLFVVQNPKLRALILLTFNLSSHSANPTQNDDQFTAVLFVIQALCLSATGIIEAVSVGWGLPLPLVILHMVVQGVKLIDDARRAQKNRK